ncbi:hypothetical protein Q7C36_005718 [Tachysurus vachellii]|uniref:DUF4795 domain-containing protein n=1 Tax=Tachysurus vachellii TaxID=175792 RepID=A0AA88NIB1_TACVA|nr:hypothetical protein Q7C36_005718 [Tachysurus vachellii]
MSKDSLIELLNQSIDPTEGSVVNFKTLHLLLHNLVNRHGVEREKADRREADVGRDVTESLFASDTSEQLEDSEEGVSKVISSTSLMQDMVKEIQELKGEANNLKKEVGTLRDQLDQKLKDSIIPPGFSDTSREVIVFPTKKDQLQEMDKSLEVRLEHLEGVFEEFSKSLVTASQGSESISGSEQQLYLQTADLRNSFQKLDKEVQNVKQELLVLIKEQKRSSEKEIQDKELKDSITGPGFSDTSREVNVFQTSKDQLQEMEKRLVARVEHLEGVFEEFSKSLVTASQGSESISGSEQQLYLQTADLRNSFQKLDKEMQNVKQELLVLIKEQKRSLEKEMKDKELKDSIIPPGFSDTSREVNVFQTNKDQLQEMEKRLVARVEHLEGVFEEFSKSLVTASQGSDSISGSEQQLYLQTSDLRNSFQKLDKEVQNMKQELLVLIKEQKRSLEKEIQDKELKDSIIPPGFSDTSREVIVFQTNKDQLQEMEKRLVARVEHLEGVFEEFSKSLVTASQGSESISGSEQQLYLQTADLRNSFQKLDKEMQNVKQELLVLIKEQKRSSEKEMKDKELKDSIIGPGFSDTSREVFVFSTNELVARVEHLEGVFEEFSKSLVTASQGSESISGSDQQLYLQTADLRNAFQKLDKKVENVKQELLVLIKEQERSSEKEIQDKELKDSITGPGFSDTSREVIVFATNKDQLQEKDKHLEVRLEHLEGVFEEFSKSLVTASRGSDSISGSEQQLYLQTADLRNSFQKLDKEMQNVKQELLVLIQEQKRSSEKEIQDKELKDSIIGSGFLDTKREVKDQLQEMDKRLEARVEPLEVEREYILGPESVSESSGEVEELSKFKVTASHGSESISGSEQQLHLQTADLRNAIQKLYKEMQNMKQELLVLMKEQKRSSEKEIQYTDLYKIMKELEEKKADKMEVKIVEDFKANMQTLEAKVLLCDTAADQLNRMIQDLASNICVHEQNCQRIIEKIFRELDRKLNHTEMDYLERQLEDSKMKIFQLVTQATDSYDAAVVRKHCLPKSNCLSCDRPTNMSIPGQPMLALPELPGLRPSKRYFKRRLRQSTNLDQSEGLHTESSMEQTRETDSCGFDAQVNKEYQDSSYMKTAEVRVTLTPPTEAGYCKNKDRVNQSQLLTSSGRKPKQLLSLQEQHPNTELICSGSRCLENSKQCYPEDNLPQTPQS